MYTIALTLLLAILFCTYVCWLYNADKVRWFIERQQMTSKIDTLMEHILQQSGHPIDLNKSAREKFRARVADGAFRSGWKSDKPATPDHTHAVHTRPTKET